MQSSGEKQLNDKTLDERFLELARMTAAKAAQILGRSRQTISRGIKGEGDDEEARYFRDQDLLALYANVEVESPSLAPGLLQFMRDHYGLLAERAQLSSQSTSFVDRLENAKRVWIVLPDMWSVQDEMRLVIEKVLSKDDVAIDLFVDDEVGHETLQAMVADALPATHPEGHFSVRLWQPLERLSSFPRLIIMDPQSPKNVAAFTWEASTGFRGCDSSDAARYGKNFVTSIFSDKEKLEFRTISVAAPDGADESETVNKERARKLMATTVNG